MEYSKEIKEMNLWEKIANISSEIDYLQKDDTVGFGANKYKAISSEKVIGVCAEKMVKYGVVIYPSKQAYNRTDETVIDREGKEKINRVSDVDVEYTVVNIHNPAEQFITVASGTGVDTQDKGVGKAQTYAYKNMLVKLFAIPTGDDTDKVHSDDYTDKLMGSDKKKPDNKPEGNKPPTDLKGDNDSYTITTKQRQRLYAIAGAKGYDKAQVENAVKIKFKKDIKDLTKQEYDQVCNGYENAKNKGEK